MKSKKIFVYDNQHYFGRFLKYKFGKKYDLEIFKNLNEQEDFTAFDKEYSFVFFVIYADSDLYDFLKIYTTDIPMIVASDNKEILKKMSQINNVLLFDTSLTRTKITDNISNLFSLCYLS